MVAIILYHQLITGENAADIYTQYTCPNDGYVYAWGDSDDPTIIWHLSACPVDAIKAQLVIELATFVQVATAGIANTADPHLRIATIIEKVKGVSKDWILNNTYTDVVNFLSDDKKLFPLIFAELIKQGVIQ